MLPQTISSEAVPDFNLGDGEAPVELVHLAFLISSQFCYEFAGPDF